MWSIIVGVLAAILSAIVIYIFVLSAIRRKYWTKKGFQIINTAKEMKGSRIRNILKRVHLTELDKGLHGAIKRENLPFAGYFEFSVPNLMICDLEVLRYIFVKDFDHFVDHRKFRFNEVDERAGKMLFFMEGEPWKELRSKMSPTFTTGKIRRMFDIIENCSQRLVNYLEEEIKISPTVDLDKGYGKYTVDVISSAAFGLESGAFREKKSVFEQMAEKLQFNLTYKSIFKFLTIFMAPKIAKFFKFKFFDDEACNFYSSTIVSTIKNRETSGEKRDDFLQLMLEASAGQLKIEEAELSAFEKEAVVSTGKVKPRVTLTEDVICAQSILFFIAGFDTTQTLLMFSTYQLAVCPDIQDKLVQEVNETFKKHGGVFTYESINEMGYMDKIVSETLRMYPPVPRLDRTSTKKYTIPGTKLVIPAGTVVIIPSYAIHHDEDIYPDPYRFDPERFSKEGKAVRNPYAYMPFGHGPRNCIGMRFALTEAKLAIAQLVHNFILEPSEKTPIPMKFAHTALLKPHGGMWLNLKPRNMK